MNPAPMPRTTPPRAAPARISSPVTLRPRSRPSAAFGRRRGSRRGLSRRLGGLAALLLGLVVAGAGTAFATVVPASPADTTAALREGDRPAGGSFAWPRLSAEDRQLTRFGNDPTGVSSPAVILFEEADVDDRAPGGRRQTIHRRLKILTPGGVDRARNTIQLATGLQRLTEFAARTVLPDGTEIPFDPGKVVRRGVPGGREEVQFELPRPGVGAILEYRYTIVGGPAPDQAGWVFQHEIPTLRSTYQWRPGFGRTSHWSLLKADEFTPMVEPVTAPGHPDSLLAARFELRDLAAVPDEAWGPPFLETRARLMTSYTRFPMTPDDYWNLFAARDRERVDRFVAGRERVTEKLLAGTPPPDTFEPRVRRAYEFAQGAVQNVEALAGSAPAGGGAHIPATADSLLAGGATNGEGVDLLFMAALAVFGIKADRAFVVDRDQAFFHREVPWAGQLSRSLVAVEVAADRVLFFSPGTPDAPPGFIPWYTQGITALVATADGARFAPTPVDDAGQNRTLRLATLQLDADGRLTGHVSVAWSGQPEIDARLRWMARSADAERGRLQEEWRRLVKGITLDSLEVQNRADRAHNLKISARVKAPGYGVLSDAGMLVNCAFLSREMRNPFATAGRRQPVFVPYPRIGEDHLTLRPPLNWKPDTVPQRIDFENAAGAYHALWIWNGEALVHERQFSIKAARLTVEEWPALRDLFEAAVAGDGTLASFVPLMLPPSKRGGKP